MDERGRRRPEDPGSGGLQYRIDNVSKE